MRRHLLALAVVSSAANAQTPLPLAPPALLDADAAAPVDPAGDPPQVVEAPLTPDAPVTRDLVRLTYSPGPWADRCPDVDDLKARVRGHLGYDPFGEPAAKVVVLLLDGADGTRPARARLDLLDPFLRSLGSQVIDAAADCEDLVATAALQMSIALDPLAAPLPVVTPNTSPPSSDPADPSIEPATEPEPPAADRDFTAPRRQLEAPMRIIMSFDGHVAAFLARGEPMFGAALGGGVRGDLWSMRGEFRADFGVDDDNASGEPGVDLPAPLVGTKPLPLLLTALPCAHLPLGSDGDGGVFELVGCGTGSVGMVAVFGAIEGFGVYVGAGGRASLEWHFEDDTALRFYGQLEGAILRDSFTSGSSAFGDAPVNLLIGVGGDIGGW